MLTDSFDDFVHLSNEDSADLPELLAEFENELEQYSDKFWGYSSSIFPLLRKAARQYVSEKLSREVLEAISLRLTLTYVFSQSSEEELIADLRGSIRKKPTIDLCDIVEKMKIQCRKNLLEAKKAVAEDKNDEDLQIERIAGKDYPATLPVSMSKTSTGVVLRLVK